MLVGHCSGTQSLCNYEVTEVVGGVRKIHNVGGGGGLSVDDHNNPSLSVLPDGRIMAALGRHIQPPGTLYRISTSAPPIQGWGREFAVPYHPSSTGQSTSYHHVFHMESGKSYLFRRENMDGALGRREQGISYIDTANLESGDAPTWTVERMMMRPNARPYALYEKWGVNKIFCIASYGHPGEVSTDCNLYGFYIDTSAGAPTYWKMDGTQIVAAVPWDLAANATLIAQETAPNDGEMWPWDVIIGPDGYPWVLYTRHPGIVLGGSGRAINIEYWFGRWTGSAWVNHQLSTGNRTPVSTQQTYAAGLCFDRSDPRKLFLSESNGDNISEIKLYSFDEVTGVKTLVRNVGSHGNGREKIRLISPEGASPPTPILFSEVESYADITDFEMHLHSEATVTYDGVAGSLDAATVALIARMSSAPDATWQARYDWLVRRLKQGGLNGTDNWSDLGALYVFMAHDAQAARLDWKGSGSTDATVTGTPSFVAGSGYAGLNTTTDYVQLPAPNAIPGFAQNNAHVGAMWKDVTVSGALIRRIASGSPVLVDLGLLRINETSGLSRGAGTNTLSRNNRQFALANRSGASATQYYMDGAQMKTGTGASGAVDSAALVVGYSNNYRMEAVTLGAGKSAAQVRDLHYALNGFRRLVVGRVAP